MVENLPGWTMFASLGFLIGHELGHALTMSLKIFAKEEVYAGRPSSETYYNSVVEVRNSTSRHGVFRSGGDARRLMSSDSLTVTVPARNRMLQRSLHSEQELYTVGQLYFGGHGGPHRTSPIERLFEAL